MKNILKIGDKVHNTLGPEYGVGEVVSLRRSAERVLVKWTRYGFTQEHYLPVIKKVEK